MLNFENIKSNIIYENKVIDISSYIENTNSKGTNILLMSSDYNFINNFYNSSVFYLKRCKGYLLSKNVYQLYENDSDYKYFKKILFNNRYISDKPVKDMLKEAKKNKNIKITSMDDPDIFPSGVSYVNNMGLHVETFINGLKNIDNLSLINKIRIFEKFIDKYISSQYSDNYNNLIIIPIESWIKSSSDIDYKLSLNPVSLILYYLKRKITDNKLGIKNVVFYYKNKFFFCNIDDIVKNNDLKFKLNILKLTGNYIRNYTNNEKEDKDSFDEQEDDYNEKDSSQKVDIENDKIGFENNIEDLSIEIINQVSEKEEEFSKRQIEFLNKNEDHISNLKFNNISLKEIVESKNDVPIPSTAINIDSPNELWKNITYTNAEKVYNLDNDIVKIFHFFGNIDKRILILTDLKVEDTSTPQDYKYTWTASYRCFKNGNKFDIKIDIPKMVDDKFMYLGGNNKYLGKQLFRIPISKSDTSEVQLVSNYNKIFSRINKEFLNNRSSSRVYKLSKVLLNENLKNIKIIKGNNSKINLKYDMDIERFDLSSVISQISYKNNNIYLDLSKLNNDHNNIIGYYKDGKKIPINNNDPFGTILEILLQDEEFNKLYSERKDSTNYVYSNITILSFKFPIIYILCYHLGISKALKLAEIEYEITDKKSRDDKNFKYIKLKDFYIKYESTTRNSMLMCGLVDCGVEMFNLDELETKNSWIDMLEILGIPRIKSDGIDNFYNLFIDPITDEVCEHYKVPNDYLKLLVKASEMLSTTGFLEHSDTSLYRLRSNEQIAGYLYYVIAEEYSRFCISLKKTKKGKMFIKQSKVIDLIMQDKMFSDISEINDLNMFETSQQVSYKGHRGMNSERAFNLEKRSYSETMNGIITGSTGFAGNVGMDRQIALNAKIKSSRGYLDEVQTTSNKDLSLGDLSATDGMIAFTTGSDDPFRQLMGYLQRNKHFVPTESSEPPLITTGVDMALPYLSKNRFSINAKYNGTVEEINEDYMLIKYDNGEKDIINLKSQSIKDSAGGMYLELKLVTNLKKGSKFKSKDIIAYDSKSYSNSCGELSYNFGTLTKIAILNTHESYEDSCKISKDLSEKMSSVIIKIREVILNKNCVIYHCAKQGTEIKEGEPLVIYQNPFDESETNDLLSKLNINSENEDEINSLGKIIIKSKVSGFIQDVKVYRTVEKSEMSPSVLKYFNMFAKPYEEKLKIVNKNNIKERINEYSFIEKQSATGKLKNAVDSIVIEYHIRTTNKFSTGDKLVLYTANKGVQHDFFPEGLEPTSEFRPNEKIHVFGSLSAINKRKVTSVPKVALVNKSIIELVRKCRDILEIKYDINSDV